MCSIIPEQTPLTDHYSIDREHLSSAVQPARVPFAPWHWSGAVYPGWLELRDIPEFASFPSVVNGSGRFPRTLLDSEAGEGGPAVAPSIRRARLTRALMVAAVLVVLGVLAGLALFAIERDREGPPAPPRPARPIARPPGRPRATVVSSRGQARPSASTTGSSVGGGSVPRPHLAVQVWTKIAGRSRLLQEDRTGAT